MSDFTFGGQRGLKGSFKQVKVSAVSERALLPQGTVAASLTSERPGTGGRSVGRIVGGHSRLGVHSGRSN